MRRAVGRLSSLALFCRHVKNTLSEDTFSSLRRTGTYQGRAIRRGCKETPLRISHGASARTRLTIVAPLVNHLSSINHSLGLKSIHIEGVVDHKIRYSLQALLNHHGFRSHRPTHSPHPAISSFLSLSRICVYVAPCSGSPSRGLESAMI